MGRFEMNRPIFSRAESVHQRYRAGWKILNRKERKEPSAKNNASNLSFEGEQRFHR